MSSTRRGRNRHVHLFLLPYAHDLHLQFPVRRPGACGLILPEIAEHPPDVAVPKRPQTLGSMIFVAAITSVSHFSVQMVLCNINCVSEVQSRQLIFTLSSRGDAIASPIYSHCLPTVTPQNYYVPFRSRIIFEQITRARSTHRSKCVLLKTEFCSDTAVIRDVVGRDDRGIKRNEGAKQVSTNHEDLVRRGQIDAEEEGCGGNL